MQEVRAQLWREAQLPPFERGIQNVQTPPKKLSDVQPAAEIKGAKVLMFRYLKHLSM